MERGRILNTVRQLFRIMERPERWWVLAWMFMALLGSILETAGIGMILPFLRVLRDPEAALASDLMAPHVERLGIDDGQTLILVLALGLIALFVLKNTYLAVQLMVTQRLLFGRIVAWGRRLLRGYIRAPYREVVGRNTSELVRNINQEAGEVAGLLHGSMTVVTELFVITGLLAVLVLQQPAASVLGLLVLAAVAWSTVSLCRRRLAHLGSVRVEEGARLLHWVRHALGGLKEVKMHRAEDYFTDAFEGSARRFAGALAIGGVLTQYPRLVIETAGAVGLVGTVALVSATGGDLEGVLPLLVLFGVVMVRLLPSINRVITGVNRFRFGAPAVATVYEELSRYESLPSSSPGRGGRAGRRFRHRLETVDLTVHYHESGEPALCGVSIAVPRGARVAVIGGSGAGKTTLLNTILGLIEPTAGRVLVDGEDIARDVEGWQAQVGYIPQDVYLLDDTVRRNVAFGRRDEEISDEAVWRALEAAHVAAFVESLEGRLGTRVGERGTFLSGGQRQRIGIARALYNDPQVLVLDEATSSLDLATEREVIGTLEALAGGKTMISVTHRVSSVQDYDTLHLLSGGRRVISGSFDELSSGSVEFQRLAQLPIAKSA